MFKEPLRHLTDVSDEDFPSMSGGVPGAPNSVLVNLDPSESSISLKKISLLFLEFFPGFYSDFLIFLPKLLDSRTFETINSSSSFSTADESISTN